MTKKQDRPGKKKHELAKVREAAPAYLVPEALYTLQEACRVLRISESTARRWIKEGRLRARKIGRDYRLLGRDLAHQETEVPPFKRFGPGNPMLKLIGAGDSGLGDLAAKHDRYLTEAKERGH